MSPIAIPGLIVDERRHSRVLQTHLNAKRAGIMLHYDDSVHDASALAWFSDPQCTNGYTWLVMRDGTLVELADPMKRTPHAGACITPKANSVFYGLSAATNTVVLATRPQLERIVQACVKLFEFHGWGPGEVRFRIRGHDEEAIWTQANTRTAGMSDEKARPLWNRLGRKIDPTGRRRDGQPVIDIKLVRAAVARMLGEAKGGDHALL